MTERDLSPDPAREREPPLERQAALERRRTAATRAWSLGDEVVLVAAGEPVPIPGGADQVYPFRAHSEYLYLADRNRPGCVLAYDPGEGWVDFVPEVTDEDRVWSGEVPAEGVSAAQLEAWLEARRGRPLAVLGCPLPEHEAEEELVARLREELTRVRRPKDALELGRMRRAAAATAAGFAAARRLIRPGLTERRLQVEIEAELFRAGGDRTAYDSIVGSGPHSAVFHFAPGTREMGEGEMVLIDAGAEVEHYAADVTRTFPVGEAFTPEQRDLYAVVLAAQKAAVARCRPGKEYRELHLETALDLARGLVDLGLLRGEPQALVESDAVALFFPHGVGHMVGLGVRDAGGYLPGREPSDRPTLRYLRLDLPLEPGYTVTIEPGLYFIPALLRSPESRRRYPREVDWERVESWLGMGGVRIEDNVLITQGEPEVLTAAIPKEL